jgi:uncharacterized protein (DUF433 family)
VVLIPRYGYTNDVSTTEKRAQHAGTAPETPSTWISRTPGVCGGEARIRNTRIPVWLLIEWRRLGQSDLELLEAYPTLRQQDLDAAWEYCRDHSAEIEECIRANADA